MTAFTITRTGPLTVTAIICPFCQDVVYSRAGHDMRYCTCEKSAIDGGFEYNRIICTGTLNQVKQIKIRLPVDVTKRDLYDDWNRSRDKYGLIKAGQPYDLVETIEPKTEFEVALGPRTKPVQMPSLHTVQAIQFKMNGWQPSDLAVRVAQIIGFSEVCPPFERDGRWQLNASNDWWLHIKDDDTAELTYRYWGAHSPEQWHALKTVIEMFL